MQTLYDTIGTHYSNYRRPDPRITTALNAEFGQAASIVNIGAGVGSYEPRIENSSLPWSLPSSITVSL